MKILKIISLEPTKVPDAYKESLHPDGMPFVGDIFDLLLLNFPFISIEIWVNGDIFESSK